MVNEQFSNFAKSTLAAGIASGAVLLTVADASKFPLVPKFRIVIDQEIFLVTAVSGNNFTITPGYEGSIQAAHGSGSIVAHIATKGIQTRTFARANNEINAIDNDIANLVGDDSTDDSAAINSIVTSLVNAVATSLNHTTLGNPQIVLPALIYNILNTLTTRPWIKFRAIGGLILDFKNLANATSLSTPGTGIRCHNQDAPSNEGSGGYSNAGNQGAFLEGDGGVIFLDGPVSGTNVTTLTALVATTDTIIHIASAGALPASGNYYIMIDYELMQVASGQGTTSLTVNRQQNGTPLRPHISGAQIQLIYSNVAIDVGDQAGTATTGQYDMRNTSVNNIVIKNFGTGIFLRGTNTYFVKPEKVYIYSANFSLVTENINGVNSGELNSFRAFIFSGGVNGYVSNCSGTDNNLEDGSIDFMNGSAILAQNFANFMTTFVINCHIENCQGGIVTSTISTLSALKYVIRNLVYGAQSVFTHGYGPRQALFRGKMYLDLDGIITGYANKWIDATVGLFMVDSTVSIINFKNVHWNAFSFLQLTAQALLENEDSFFTQGVVGNDLVTTPMPTWIVDSHSGITAVVDTIAALSVYGATKSIKLTCTATGNFYVIKTGIVKTKPGEIHLANWCAQGATGSDSSSGTCNIQMQFKFTSSTGQMPSVTDGGAFGDSLNALYSDTSDPAWLSGNARTYPVKGGALRRAVTPAGYDQVQLYTTVGAMNVSDVIRLLFNGFVKTS